MFLAILGGVVALAAIVVPSSVYVVKQQTNVIIERLGKFKKVSQPGINFRIPLIDSKAGLSDLRIQQFDLDVETKTKDNVFVVVGASVQYKVNPDKIYDAHYKLSAPERQMRSYVFDVIRSTIPTMHLDEVFERKGTIANEVRDTISEEMKDFGYDIVKTLINDISPDEKVKESMNEINAAQRKREATQQLAEADKIKIVTEATARAEAQRLQGQGMANQRKEIIEGFRDSVSNLEGTNITAQESIAIIMFSQYLETLADMGRNGASSVMIPSGPNAMGDMFSQMRNSIISGEMVSEANRGQQSLPAPAPAAPASAPAPQLPPVTDE